jgi:hypothetical protein
MVQLAILSGSMAGTRWVARHFPVRIGRAFGNDLQLEEGGVWDEHLQVLYHPREGFTLKACPDALVTVNHQPAQVVRLRNGDLLEFGSVRMQFWLAETRQRGLRFRECLVWLLIALVSLGQIAVIYWLLR